MAKHKTDIPPPSLAPGVSLTDTHCHLDMYAQDTPPDQIIAAARQGGVRTIITVGIDLASSRAAIRLAADHPGVYATVGIHPHNVAELNEQDYEEMAQLAAQPKVVAYGEIGLDYARQYAAIPHQLEHCRRQVRLARDLGLPLIIHDREAHAEILAVLTEAGQLPAGGVMHCFSGDRAFAEQVLALGFFISIPGVITFAKATDLQEAVRHIPLDRLLLETDGPFLAPVPHRGRTNFPHFLPYTAQKVAELKGLELEEVATATAANACRLFRIEVA